MLYLRPFSVGAACRGTSQQAAPCYYNIYSAKSVRLTDELTILTNAQLAINQCVTSFFCGV